MILDRRILKMSQIVLPYDDSYGNTFVLLMFVGKRHRCRSFIDDIDSCFDRMED